MNLAYRTTQFFRTMVAKIRPQDPTLVEANLTPPLAKLFWQMSSADQAHGLRVLQNLITQGEKDSVLLAAALLHDVGKIRFSLRVWERVLIVLSNWLIPDIALRWGAGEPAGWQRPFVIATHHPAWGAEILSKTGGSEDLIELVRRHQEPLSLGSQTKIERWLRRLQEIDGMN